MNVLATYHMAFAFYDRLVFLHLSLSLPFAEPITEVVGGPELHINKGSTINLTCIVKFAPEPPPTVVWSHNRQVSLQSLSSLTSKYALGATHSEPCDMSTCSWPGVIR